MIAGLPLGFAQPLVLLGLISLPVLWWLLRLVPPRPRLQKLGPEKLLLDILPKEETPQRTPWWLTLLRLTLAALLIIAAAGPLWLSDGVDVARGPEFVTELGRLVQGKSITVVEGGVAPAHALTAADNAAGSLTVKVLRAGVRDNDVGLVRALDPKGLPLGEAA